VGTQAGRAGLDNNPLGVLDAGLGPGAIVGTRDALKVDVRNIQGMAIEIVTLRCAGDCADVEAVAHGGNPPYAFAWDDGSSNPKRHVCPSASAALSVSATDTGIALPEFKYDAQTVRANVTAEVLECNDAGTPGALCFQNPSFDGTPGISEYMLGLHTTAWAACEGSPDIWDATQSWDGTPGAPPASDGATYLVLYASSLGITVREAAGEQLCAPLVAGKRYSFTIDLSFRPQGAYGNATAGAIEVWSSLATCGTEQLLWTSPTVSADWRTHCVTFTAQQPFDYIQLKAVKSSANTGVFLDKLVPVAACPP
jgi:hypothetical protein